MLVALFLASLVIVPHTEVKAQTRTIIVPDDFPTIQAAVNNASARDTVLVKAGTYYETLIISKSISLIGAGQEATFINANKTTNNIIDINASAVTIQGFTICNNNGYQQSVPQPNGIRVEYRSNDINIVNNTITAIQYGCGISFYYDSESNIIGNNITAPGGIFIESGSDNNLTNNIVTNGGCQLTTTSTNNIIIGNYFGNDTYNYGLELNNDCSNNLVVGNTFAYNAYGLALEPPSSNRFYHNNFIQNTFQALLFGRKADWAGLINLWDNGTEGNYWSDYSGNGNQPYPIIANWDQNVVYYDNYPLISPFNASSSTSNTTPTPSPTPTPASPPSGTVLDQATLISTAQTENGTGSPQRSFARGTELKTVFVLQIFGLINFSAHVVMRITLLQPDQSVFSIVTTIAIISTPTIMSCDQLIPVGVITGNWTAYIQIFASDGVTPIGVAVLNFTVS